MNRLQKESEGGHDFIWTEFFFLRLCIQFELRTQQALRPWLSPYFTRNKNWLLLRPPFSFHLFVSTTTLPIHTYSQSLRFFPLPFPTTTHNSLAHLFLFPTRTLFSLSLSLSHSHTQNNGYSTVHRFNPPLQGATTGPPPRRHPRRARYCWRRQARRPTPPPRQTYSTRHP